MKKLSLGLIALCFFQFIEAQLPDFYKTVHRVSWIVKDLEKVKKEWDKLGFPPALDHDQLVLSNVKFRGQPARAVIEAASVRLGDVEIDWIQPVSGNNAFSEFLERHGEGIFSLVHQLATPDIFEKELARLDGLGIGVLQSQSVDSGDGDIRIAYLDTQSDGKYSLGLIQYPGAPVVTPGSSSGRVPFDKKMSQFAFVIRDPRPVSALWKKIGFPKISVTHGPLRDKVYRGKPGQFDHNLGWQRHGSVAYEWCMPLAGPTAYEDHLKTHGEGFHHLGFQVDEIDKVIAEWSALGYPPLQSGAWGEEGKKGSGRFAYMDTDSIGGVVIELLWSKY